ncbi:MAG: 4-amino-4-deoxychorismate lyase [Flavobacteriales bacterium]|nr:4-amino-4-deoxychorismate lyase [Flavobacteriales bacterium]
MNQIRHNGKNIPLSAASLIVENRAFHFGDGFFESIRVVNGRIVFFQNHYQRILDTCKALRIDIPPELTPDSLEEEINLLVSTNEIAQGGRVRLTIFRKSTGYYLPQSNQMDYVIEAYPIEDNFFKLNEQGCTVDIYPDVRKDVNMFSMYKTLNCSLYIMASMYANERGIDDSLIQNNRGTIIEGTSTNLFLVSNGVLYTPSLDEGCIAGTMRMNIINIALENEIKVYECSLNPQNLLVADEIFLSNAIKGIEWISSYRTKRYFNDMSKELTRFLNKFVAETEG